MKVFVLLAVVFTTALATSVPVTQYHVHADSGRGGNGRNPIHRPFPARLLELCASIEDHEHVSGPASVGHHFFRVQEGNLISCADLAASATVVGDDTAAATDAPAADAAADDAAADDAAADDAA